jgi:hypothetical protein
MTFRGNRYSEVGKHTKPGSRSKIPRPGLCIKELYLEYNNQPIKLFGKLRK